MATVEEIALTLTPGIGPTACRRLAAFCSAAELFGMSHEQLCDLLGPHNVAVHHIEQRTAMARAEQEAAYTARHGIRTLWLTDADYPQRLRAAGVSDAPPLLFVLGHANLNPERALSVVGTRRATPYGRTTTARLVHELQPTGAPIVSGLAYGIDTAAHSAALEAASCTVAVLGHGLDRIYPPENRGLAEAIVRSGGALVSEYPSGTQTNPRYFPARNRIIAALADATLVVEAAAKGGALITASMALGYRRKVLAVPGRAADPYSEGTNRLIADGKATLVQSGADVVNALGWPPLQGADGRQQSLFAAEANLGATEQRILGMLRREQSSMDQIVEGLSLSMPKVAAALFNLESTGLVSMLPGHVYMAN